MANLQTETIKITLSKMIKNSDTETLIIDAEMIASLEAVISELAGAGVMVVFE